MKEYYGVLPTAIIFNLSVVLVNLLPEGQQFIYFVGACILMGPISVLLIKSDPSVYGILVAFMTLPLVYILLKRDDLIVNMALVIVLYYMMSIPSSVAFHWLIGATFKKIKQIAKSV